MSELRPGLVLYTPELARLGYRLNKFARSIRHEASRRAFLADEDAYMRGCGLGDAERALVAARDWLGLSRAGGNMYALIKLARALGIPQAEVGAQMKR